MGHVGSRRKTLLSTVSGALRSVYSEVGAITQHIGATIVPIEAIRAMSGTMGKSSLVSVPGLLFIDTPRATMRSTLPGPGGALANMAILVVDINQWPITATDDASPPDPAQLQDAVCYSRN